MGVTVDDLLSRPFLTRSRQEKCRIIADGKPQPVLNMAAVVMVNDSDKPMVQTHHFTSLLYEQVPWLTACEKRESVFCWPCLLFSSSSSWSTTGISDFGYVIEGMQKHEESAEHIKANLQMEDIVELNIPSSNESHKQLSDDVKTNRAILKRLSDVVCNQLVKEKSYYKRKNGCQISQDSCVKNLQFLRNYDVLNCNFIEYAIELINTSPNAVNDVVDTLSDLVKSSIKKEIQSSSYVSLILSDHTELSALPQISSILRYIKDGKIYERFLGFSNVGNVKQSDTICQHISSLVKEFQFSDKFIGLSIDGGVLPLCELPELMTYLRSCYPCASFVPCHSHGLDYVLQQSLESIKECSLALKTLNNLKIYLQKKSKRYKALETFMAAHNPAFPRTKWFTRSQIISVLNADRKYFVSFFEFMVQNSNKWTADEIVKAVAFQKILEDFKTVFLLEVFSVLFQHFSNLNKILNSRFPEDIFDGEAISQLTDTLEKGRENGFDEIWSKVLSVMRAEVPGPQSKRIKTEDEGKVHEYRELYASIFDHAIHEIDIRFSNIKRLKFCHLIKLNQCVNFTNDMLHQLAILYGADYDEELVKNEIIVLRTNSRAFKDKSPVDLLHLFSQPTLKNTFKCVHKITQFLFALPIKPVSGDASTSKFQDIVDWSYIPNESGRVPGDVSVPCVELDILQDLKKSTSFHADVFANFLKMTKNSGLQQ